MWGRVDDRRTFGGHLAAEREARLDVGHAVVARWDDMRVQVDEAGHLPTVPAQLDLRLTRG